MAGVCKLLTPRPSWLKTIRESKGLTITDTANMCGLGNHGYSDIEKGFVEPKKESAQKIARCLGFNVKAFKEHPLNKGGVPLNWLKLLRLKAGWYSIEKFSLAIGVSRAIYKTIEKGNFLEISPKLKQKIADKLGFPVSYFDNLPGMPQPKPRRAKTKEPEPLPPWRVPEYTTRRQAEKERCRVENEARLKRASEKRSFMAVDASGNVSGGWLEYVTSNDAKMRRYE